MKKVVFGLILGLLLSTGIVCAAEELVIKPNTFPVYINGVKTEVEGYNINGFTFLKLADFSKAGLTVKFNETDKQIEVTSSQPTAEVATEATKGDDTVSVVPLNKYGLPDFSNLGTKDLPPLEDDGKNQYFSYNGIKYIWLGWDEEHQPLIPETYNLWKLAIDDKGTRKIQLSKKNGERGVTILDDIPYTKYLWKYFITYDYYINTFLPAIEEGAE